MVNKIKTILGEIVGVEQSSFIPGRQILDNILVYQKVLHSMRTKQGKKGCMVLKLDLEKAYDRLSWSFIRSTLREVGFSHDWIRNIMGCIETAQLAPLWKGKQLDWVKPTRGIRQGDALSPYIFVLCMERLGHLIHDMVDAGKWKGVKTSRYGPNLSYLFFTDDLVLFAEAS